MKTAIITGAGGFIGGALTQKLLEKGYKVYGVDISETALSRFTNNKNFIPLCVDLNKIALSEIIREKIDIIFHLAWGGIFGGGDYYNTELQINNIFTAVKTIEGAAGICNRFIFFASSYEYMRDTAGKDIPVNIYGSAKKTAAEMCESVAYRHDIKFNKIILTNTFGIGDKSKKAVNTIIRLMINNTPLTLVDGNNKNDWVYIDDTVSGIIAATEKGKEFKDYYIGHRDITTFREKIITMRDALQPEMELTFGGMEEDTFIDYSLIELDTLYNDTGFECQADFRESIIKTAEWLRKEGAL